MKRQQNFGQIVSRRAGRSLDNVRLAALFTSRATARTTKANAANFDGEQLRNVDTEKTTGCDVLFVIIFLVDHLRTNEGVQTSL